MLQTYLKRLTRRPAHPWIGNAFEQERVKAFTRVPRRTSVPLLSHVAPALGSPRGLCAGMIGKHGRAAVTCMRPPLRRHNGALQRPTELMEAGSGRLGSHAGAGRHPGARRVASTSDRHPVRDDGFTPRARQGRTLSAILSAIGAEADRVARSTPAEALDSPLWPTTRGERSLRSGTSHNTTLAERREPIARGVGPSLRCHVRRPVADTLQTVEVASTRFRCFSIARNKRITLEVELIACH